MSGSRGSLPHLCFGSCAQSVDVVHLQLGLLQCAYTTADQKYRLFLSLQMLHASWSLGIDFLFKQNTRSQVRLRVVVPAVASRKNADRTHIHIFLQVMPIPMEQHAQWRYLISTDGQAASWKLAKLMAIDSVVLKYRCRTHIQQSCA